MIAPRAGSREITMTTVSKYGAADAEAQTPAPAPEKTPLGRAKVALICVAAALSGAAVASVARVRTRAYVADLYAGLGGKFIGPDQLNEKQCGNPGIVCPGTTRCYEKVKDDGTTKYKCAESESLSSSWKIATARPGSTRTSKKKPTGAGTLSGEILTCSPAEKAAEVCRYNFDPVCGEDGKTHGNSCEACSWGKNDKYTMVGC